ncbi:SubName: Full=Uncharacterized protein {ECO:0000313/EMBL:CCA67137.1} [Serendipita indica DSM 11827]|nr:SubName: Full=Uncharacterized protein {ECO:0000313/EMBL:CCA67137.1} [Serendipita indica DSM 11827]
MPRLLARLAVFLKADAAGKVKYRQRTVKPVRKPVVNKTRPVVIPNLSRTQSFLLDPNPILNKDDFQTPETPPPLLPWPQSRKELPKNARLMSSIEVEAMASPYARMLSAPQRTCLFTRAILPTDLLIRFGGATDPSTGTRYLLPNNIEHPKFAARIPGKNFWVSCWKDVVRQMIETKKHAMISPNLQSHPLLLEQVESMLQQRIVQELELLRDRLRPSKQLLVDVHECTIRRITEEERSLIYQDGGVSIPGGQAILEFGETKPEQVNDDATPSRMILDTSTTSPRHVPLYFVSSFMPSDSLDRAHQLVHSILKTEANAIRKSEKGTEPTISASNVIDSTSPAMYLVRSTAASLLRADTVPLCISLWRMNLWAGQGWADGLWGRWEQKSGDSVPEFLGTNDS